ncbi:MAG: hypothetical protein M3O22_03935 [Pseudomonadota bacterium]|nr:hypothetical protein [Pseudomonadota bacterium]
MDDIDRIHSMARDVLAATSPWTGLLAAGSWGKQDYVLSLDLRQYGNPLLVRAVTGALRMYNLRSRAEDGIIRIGGVLEHHRPATRTLESESSDAIKKVFGPLGISIDFAAHPVPPRVPGA